MNKEYILEKLAETTADYIGNGPHPVMAIKGTLNKGKKERENAAKSIKAHMDEMNRTGIPMTMSQFRQGIDEGRISNPLVPSFLKRHGKSIGLLGAGALAGVAGLSLLAANAQGQTPPSEPELMQVYNTPTGQMPYGQ